MTKLSDRHFSEIIGLILSFYNTRTKKNNIVLFNCRRYYISLFLELSDIAMPFVRAAVSKVSAAVSYFWVSMIGRSLGLIFSGIRQSLGWR